MDFKQGNGQSGSVGVLPLEIAPTLVRPGNESRLLKMGCLNVRGCNEVEKRDEIGFMSKGCK